MEQHQLTRKEYEELHKISSNKRAVKEMLESLKAQLSTSIYEEDKWWQKMSKKYKLEPKDTMYSINHDTQEIVGIPRPQKQKEPTPTQEVAVRERPPEINKLFSASELEAIKKSREATQ